MARVNSNSSTIRKKVRVNCYLQEVESAYIIEETQSA